MEFLAPKSISEETLSNDCEENVCSEDVKRIVMNGALYQNDRSKIGLLQSNELLWFHWCEPNCMYMVMQQRTNQSLEKIFLRGFLVNFLAWQAFNGEGILFGHKFCAR